MKKNSYISPEVMVVTLRPIQMLADSFEKGDGNFDPDDMTFSREYNSEGDNTDNTDNTNNRTNVWDNIW